VTIQLVSEIVLAWAGSPVGHRRHACPWRASLIGNINDMLDDCGLAL
jgi:hypothetical protein